ncbi:2TM domain-containing protein [Chromobacterium violaceum]|uniref:Anaerobic benzoate catabolism transcriptional regulator n=1 Tax=Chromobacterium violaceum TaxID=536 RepID=A0AAX2M4L8_CHRVL|nr:2TM domain-containing protein [Chromobacterium violaceum]OLZ80110.1 XRE family transcriptional regulator [Chromobacterium violaceum]STB69047.1 anaerobic benzoate catabolism transcriptional regulator [Chromobacterium violaceum]SUX31119.1 anaerobic benzoate catabolism transcriptional regulator [Chromobacterium violaceum]
MLIQKLRLQRGWSQQQLADLSGLSVRTIQRIERGQGASVESLKSLASVFEIDFSELNQEPAMMDPTTPDAIAAPAASRELEEMLALQHVNRLKRFYRHLIQYALVMAALAVINLLTSPHHWWVMWPALGWGMGLLAHAINAFELLPVLGPDWERRQVEKRLGRKLSS